MRLIRTNNAIYWLAVVVAAAACSMPSPKLAIKVAAVSLVIVAAGAFIRYVPRHGVPAYSVWRSLPPVLALLLALLASVRALI